MSNLSPSAVAEPCISEPAARPVLEALPGRLTDVAGLPIRRLLPRASRRLVGPWCFLDSYGPLEFAAGKPMDVAPHPHIGLQTVSWLLEGEVVHNDSLGLTGPAGAGVLNLMTAGRGIAHAEETPPGNSGRLRGLQLWVALPEAQRSGAPAFAQHGDLPVAGFEGGSATVLLGTCAGLASPARTFSPIVGADVAIDAGRRVVLPLEAGFEHALVPLRGRAKADGQALEIDALYYLGTERREICLEADADAARVLLIGGAPFGESVLMWWNFVARTSDEIVAAREDWEAGRRFGAVTAYAGERLPAPPFVARPVPRS
jgi:redox-sensitive bicupin YhaK (pirin superfamily)